MTIIIHRKTIVDVSVVFCLTQHIFNFKYTIQRSLRNFKMPTLHTAVFTEKNFNCFGYGIPWWLSSKESICNAGDTGDSSSIPGLGRSPGGGHGNPLQYSCLENPIDRAAKQAPVHGVTKSCTQLKQLSTDACSGCV